MAEVRNFRDYKNNKKISEEIDDDLVDEMADDSFLYVDESDDEPSYQEKIRNHKLLVFYRTILTMIVAAAIVVVVYINWKEKIYTEARELSSISLTGMDGVSVYSLGSCILRVSKDGANCIGADGSAKWDQSFEMQQPIVRICNETVAIGDKNGNIIYVSNLGGSKGKINTNLPIKEFCVSSQGVVSVILKDGNVTRINIYDSKGTELATIKATMANSGYPVSMSLSPNGQLLGISYLGEKSGQVGTKVTFFNFGDVGQNKTDNMVSSFNYDKSVIPVEQFLNSDTNFAVADDRILFFKGAEVPKNPITNLLPNKEILSVFHSNNYVGLVCAGNSEKGAYEFLVYNSSGKLVLTHYFDMAYTNIVFSDDQFTIYNSEEWVLCGLDGTQRYKGRFDNTVLSIIPGPSRSRFTVVTAADLKQIELR